MAIECPPENMTSPAKSAGTSSANNGGINILLVDDEVRNLDVLESILGSAEYGLVRAQTAEEALMALLNGEFAAMVLDIQMPGTNGIELAHLIKQRKRSQHIPIIFLTAYYQDDKDVIQGYEVGAVDYLTKPINSQILKSKIGVFVELFRKTRDLARLNQTLETEIANRQSAEQALSQVNHELEARVNQRTNELMRANRAKDDFLAALSHELRTPLNPVLLLASESAADPELPESIRQTFETIVRNVTLEARLIDDLLDLTRIIHGKLLLEKRNVNMHAVLQEALATIQEDARSKRISITVNLAAEEHIVFADAVRIQQIFWNVLKNAVKFTHEGGHVTIETRSNRKTGSTSVRIADTGIGLTPEEISYIFSAFSQGDHAGLHGSHRFGGLGLGLTISRMLVELHSGNIRAESAGRAKGAAFTIELPFVETRDLSTMTAPSEPVTEVVPKPGIRILLVEDHEPTRAVLVQLLTRRHYKVATAGSVAEARRLADQDTFDLVLSDIGLPDGSGYALMAELRDRFGLRGIALTGYGMEEDVARAKVAGFVAHLTKPVRMESLEKALYAAK
jgi:signal transduction histidine kinase